MARKPDLDATGRTRKTARKHETRRNQRNQEEKRLETGTIRRVVEDHRWGACSPKPLTICRQILPPGSPSRFRMSASVPTTADNLQTNSATRSGEPCPEPFPMPGH